MKNIEYTKMAYLYDEFYKNKKYTNEVNFIREFIVHKNNKILDVGSGTGNHSKILFDFGYNIYGFDKSKEMVQIANQKIKNHFFIDDILHLKHKEKYDLIFSFFAVFNHLKNYKEFERALANLKDLLNPNGRVIIDLHNPQNNGYKKEMVDNAIRIMKWRKCSLLQKEFSKITYLIDNQKYITKHVFKIFKINKLEKIIFKLGFDIVGIYENYNISSSATLKSKNIQLVLSLPLN